MKPILANNAISFFVIDITSCLSTFIQTHLGTYFLAPSQAKHIQALVDTIKLNTNTYSYLFTNYIEAKVLSQTPNKG